MRAQHPSTLAYKQLGPLAIQADVYAPAGQPRPVILWLHGGALVVGTRRSLPADQLARYLRAGYAVVAVDYRLAPESKLDAILEDLSDACRWVRETLPRLAPVNPERLAVVGHSAGGYLALVSGCCVTPRPQAIVSFYGYGDIRGPWYSEPDPFYCQRPAVSREEALAAVGAEPLAESTEPARWDRYYLYLRQNGLWPREVTGHDPHTEPGAFDRYCPVRQVDASFPPTLLLHGTADTDVPCEQSVLMAEALARAGVHHELVLLPDAPHGFDQEHSAVSAPAARDAFARVLRFLDQHL